MQVTITMEEQGGVMNSAITDGSQTIFGIHSRKQSECIHTNSTMSDGGDDYAQNTIQDISNLIKSLPENKQRKELFALHIKIAQMCVEQFKQRSLNKLIPLVGYVLNEE